MKTPWNRRKFNQKKKIPRKFHTYIHSQFCLIILTHNIIEIRFINVTYKKDSLK